MYSGTTLTPLSGRVFGAHQKIDKLARSALGQLLSAGSGFPGIRTILHFEGVNGPDAIKRKSPARDEPWHYYAPFDETDTQLVLQIGAHYDELVASLKCGDDIRAAFEAAWLAHAITDGLTPPHHHPYEEQLRVIRGGQGLETRSTLKGKLVMPGETPLRQVTNNWKMWGPHGLLTSHGFFEWGMAVLMKPMTLAHVALGERDIAELKEYGVLELFRRKAKEVAALNMYDRYHQTGWTSKLVKDARFRLAPTVVHVVTLAWYAACIDAGLAKKDAR